MAKKLYDARMQWARNGFAVVLFLLAGVSAYAITLPQCGKSQFGDTSRLTQKITVIGKDDRYTFEGYAALKGISVQEVENKFGASGIFNCDNATQMTAQVTGNNSVITTAAHMFFDQRCNRRIFNRCVFFLVKNGQPVAYEVNMNSIRKGSCRFRDYDNDWAVAELEAPTPSSVRPYNLPSSKPDFSTNKKLIHVAGYSENFRTAQGMPRFITECEVRDVGLYPQANVLTDCDSGHGSSGSGQLQPTKDGLTIVAIDVGNSNSVDGQPYSSIKNFNASAPVQGEFLAAIQDAMASTSAHLSSKNNKTR